MDIDEYWSGFVKKEGLHKSTPYFMAVCFDESDGSQPMLRMTLEGRKTVWCVSSEYWKWLEEDLPEPGDFFIVTDRASEPMCVCEVSGISAYTLDQAPESLILADGGEIAGIWREMMGKKLKDEAKRLRYELKDDMLLVFISFEKC